jgi:sterol desaturase/sphingolipid hydroxylase (fatty acid hydroxylase superfamily)
MREAKRRPPADVLQRELPRWLTGVLLLGTFALVLWGEQRRPLRRRTERKGRHDARNLAVAALSALAIRLTERPVTEALTQVVHRKRWGLVKQYPWPAWLEVTLAVVLLDYTLYLWHVLTHKVPLLWRFHRVHHADIDLEASTALRFHCAEMVLSVPWRALQVVVVGASRLSLALWQMLTLMAILFHHANLHVPLTIERWLCRLVMTPRLHGIHHSMVKGDTDSNWSTLLSWPDYLHRTARLQVPQQAIRIGVPEYRDPKDLTLWKLLRMPFGRQRPAGPPPVQATPERPATRNGV